MTDEFRQLSALAALDALAGEELERWNALREAHPEWAGDVAGDVAVVRELGQVFARGAVPPADLADRIVAAVVTEQTEPVVTTPSPGRPAVVPRRRWRSLLPALGMSAAAAAAAVAITLVATRDPGLGTPDREAQIVAVTPGDSLLGTVALYHPDRMDGRLAIDISRLKAAPTGHHYQVWVLRKGSTVMEAVGTFNVASDATHIEANLPGRGEYAALDISLEEDNGPPEHSGVSIAGATFGVS
jgi:hypothetical protein